MVFNMRRTGVADLPLHGGKAPRWLFQRMVSLSESIIDVMVHEYSSDEVLIRLSDPFWFQSLACILGYDWHSSGTTTVTCAALKQAVNLKRHGFVFTGGKGKTSRKTPSEINEIAVEYSISDSILNTLLYASRMTAKIDSIAIQDYHSLYHHSYIFTEKGTWAVIQQGLNDENGYARRYHWCSEHDKEFLNTPHTSIIGERIKKPVLDMTSEHSVSTQQISVDLVNDHPRHLQRDWKLVCKPRNQRTLDDWDEKQRIAKTPRLVMPRCLNWKKIHEIYEWQPKDYEALIFMEGVGSSTIRALALISEVIYGESPSWTDPVKYSYAHGGKDGVPFPVDTKRMDKSVQVLKQGIVEANMDRKEKLHALNRLRRLIPVDT